MKGIKTNVLLISCDSPGKTCLINAINGIDFTEHTIPTMGTDCSFFSYEFNNENYKIKFFDTPSKERFMSISFSHCEKSDIIIYLFNLSKDNDIKENFLKIIKENIKNSKKKFIYLINNKIDIKTKYIEKYRKQAKILIDRGKINKYFEISAKTREGMDLFIKSIKIDSLFILEKIKFPEDQIIKFEYNFIKLNKLNKFLNL